MCRHAGYVGPAIPLDGPLLDAPNALAVQATRPRHQPEGVRNVDGWGVASWRETQLDRYRSTTPLPDDADGQAQLRDVDSAAFVAAVRRATPGLALAVTGNAPFVQGGWVFSLNGFVGAFAATAHVQLVAALSDARRAALEGDTDSEVLFGLTLDRTDAGADPVEALTEVAVLALDAAGDAPSRLNLLLCDGHTLWATRWGNSLFTRHNDTHAVVASEPWDDDPSWTEVPESSVVVARPGRCERTLLVRERS